MKRTNRTQNPAVVAFQADHDGATIPTTERGGGNKQCPMSRLAATILNAAVPGPKGTATMLLLALPLATVMAQTELIPTGGFESPTGWTVSGGAQITTYGSLAHSGSYYLWLGGALNEKDAAYYTVTLPTALNTASLGFWVNINSAEGNVTAYDTFAATIRNTSGAVLATVTNLSNINQDPGPGNPYYHHITFDMRSIMLFSFTSPKLEDT